MIERKTVISSEAEQFLCVIMILMCLYVQKNEFFWQEFHFRI